MRDTLSTLITLLLGRPDGVRRSLYRSLRARILGDAGASASPPPSAQPDPSAPVADDLTGFVAVARVDELRPGELVEAMVGHEPVVVCRSGSAYFVVDATCPHAGGALGDGDLEGHNLVCPLHGWRFDVRTGACLEDPASPVGTWRVKVSQGRILVAR